MAQQEEGIDEIDAISTVALLIDDLSSEDPNAKLHSIQRLGQIATLLGPARCIDELLPMLTDLIDKIDSNPELMMCLAVELGKLPEHLSAKNDLEGRSKNSVHLLKPLEFIVACDDSVVRQKTVESLCSVSNILHETVINSAFLEMCKRLKKGDLFSKRIAACQLYAHVYDRLNEENTAIFDEFVAIRV